MHCNVTLVAMKSSSKLKYQTTKKELKTCKRSCYIYSFKRSSQLGNKRIRVMYTFRNWLQLSNKLSLLVLVKKSPREI